MAKVDIQGIIERHGVLKRSKQSWLPLYQALAQYILQRKQYFTSDVVDSPFLINKVFDSTAPHAAHLMASSILGQIWPNPFESFEFVPQVAQEDEVFSDAYDMMNDVNEVLPINLSLPEAGVMTTFHEAIMDLAIFGTAAAAVIETGNYSVPVCTKALDAKTMSISENDQGQVDTVYMEKTYTVAQMVQRYGYNNVSKHVRSLYDQGKSKLEDKIKVLHVIEPRRERNPLKLGVQDMPFASIHIEIDQKHLLLESGFNEMPILVARMWKNVGEVYGRSPAMDALPDIRALNKLVEMFEKAGEMGLDPPKMVATEDVLGAGKIPWGPGVAIPIHSSARLGSDRPPIEPILTVTNPGWAQQRIMDLRDNVKQYFMLDLLSDLNNRSRQTLGEANIRNELRMFMAGPMLIRILIELVTPFLDRAFNIMLGMGYFGVVRGSTQDLQMQMMGIEPKYVSEDFIARRSAGLKGYRINYISPAARLMKLEEALGLEKLTDYVITKLYPVNPNVVHTFNFDEAVRAMQRLSGASQKVLYSPAETQQQRQAQAEQTAQVQELQAAQAGAMAFKDMAKGVKDLEPAARTA